MGHVKLINKIPIGEGSYALGKWEDENINKGVDWTINKVFGNAQTKKIPVVDDIGDFLINLMDGKYFNREYIGKAGSKARKIGNTVKNYSSMYASNVGSKARDIGKTVKDYAGKLYASKAGHKVRDLGNTVKDHSILYASKAGSNVIGSGKSLLGKIGGYFKNKPTGPTK